MDILKDGRWKKEGRLRRKFRRIEI